jgi:hypothetical protein
LTTVRIYHLPMPATHLLHPLMWLPYVRKNTNYAAVRYPVSHILHIWLSQTPYNLRLLNLACVYPNSGLQLHTTNVHASFWHSIAILRPLLAYNQRSEAHQFTPQNDIWPFNSSDTRIQEFCVAFERSTTFQRIVRHTHKDTASWSRRLQSLDFKPYQHSFNRKQRNVGTVIISSQEIISCKLCNMSMVSTQHDRCQSAQNTS